MSSPPPEWLCRILLLSSRSRLTCFWPWIPRTSGCFFVSTWNVLINRWKRNNKNVFQFLFILFDFPLRGNELPGSISNGLRESSFHSTVHIGSTVWQNTQTCFSPNPLGNGLWHTYGWDKTTYFCVEAIKSKWKIRGKLGRVVQIHVCRFSLM